MFFLYSDRIAQIFLPIYFTIIVTTMPFGLANAEPSNLNTTNTIDPTHRFSLRYNSTLIQIKPEPRWNMEVWIEAAPSVLSQIEKVTYVPYPKFEGKIFNITSVNNKFALYMNVFAGPKVNTTVYFKDKEVIEYPTLQTSVTGPLEVFPINLDLNPSINGLTAVINGNATATRGSISKIQVDWGDGNFSKGNFPFSHNYTKTIARTINVTAFSSLGIHVDRSIATSPLLLEKSIPKDSAFNISPKGNAILNVSTSFSNMQDNIPMDYNISGILTSNANGSGIPRQSIIINLVWKEHPEFRNTTHKVLTQGNGYYTYAETLTLAEGNYKILVKPESHIYAGLSVTKDLFVHGHPITQDQLITYLVAFIGITIAAIGAIVKVPSFFTSVKQGNNLSNYMSIINKRHHEFIIEKSIDENQFLKDLEDIRSKVTNLLEQRKISENQYRMLDDKITYLADKAEK
jgi:pYEATS domain-containing protein involved in immunity